MTTLSNFGLELRKHSFELQCRKRKRKKNKTKQKNNWEQNTEYTYISITLPKIVLKNFLMCAQPVFNLF